MSRGIFDDVKNTRRGIARRRDSQKRPEIFARRAETEKKTPLLWRCFGDPNKILPGIPVNFFDEFVAISAARRGTPPKDHTALALFCEFL